MKLVVTSDSFSKNDFLKQELEKKWNGEIVYNSKGKSLTRQDLFELLDGAQAMIVGLDKVDEELLDTFPNLKFISKYGVGLDNIDIEACQARNVKIGWTGGVNSLSVAEMALGFALCLKRNMYQTSSLLSMGTWKKDGGFLLSEKTFGIIGFGAIGKKLYDLLKPFNCNIFVNDINLSVFENTGISNTDIDVIYSKSDIISIHIPLSPKTKGLISKNEFKKMSERRPVLINTSRGGIIDENATIEALEKGYISSLGIDVYENEPMPSMKLVSRKDVFCTPHIGGNAKEAVMAMGIMAVENLLKICNNR